MATSAEQAAAAVPLIPVRLAIGVTGHRELGDEGLLAGRVREVLQRLPGLVPPTSQSPLAFTLLSPLAEGADRLVAREVLAIPGSRLEAVLPLQAEQYLEDFVDSRSRAEFERLLAQAQVVTVMPPATSRLDAYTRAGRHVVDRCDVLIAVWNGAPAGGRAGTGDIVAYARRRSCPVFWIHSDTGEITGEREGQLGHSSFTALDRYNGEKIDPAQFAADWRAASEPLRATAGAVGFPPLLLRELEYELLPHQVRSDLLSQRYQRRYFRSGTAVYAAAAGAVTVVAFQTVFLPEQPALLLLEVALMSAILALLWLGERQRWHDKWIDYRFLSERFRSALFLAAAGVELERQRGRRQLGLAWSAADWMVAAFDSVWGSRPRLGERQDSELEPLRGFLLAAWIDGQIAYHRETGARHGRAQRRLEVAGTSLFAATFIAAAWHALAVGPHWTHPMLSFAAIALPAVGSALMAVRFHREYQRSAHRSTEMVRHLEQLKEEVHEADSVAKLRELIRQVADAMLREHEDWRVVVRFRRAELPA